MSSATIPHQRLRNQGVAGVRQERPAAVVERLGAVQAQDFLGALWAVGLRTRAAAERDVEAALADRSIVRTWPMRGTLHFVPAADARWMLALLTPRVIARSAGRHRQLELDDAVFARCRRVAERALGGGVQLTRPALYERFEAAGVATAGSRGLHVLAYLAQRGVLCFGAREGKQQTFALLDEWVPESKSRRLEGEEALAEVARRYVTGHGPATANDLAWWAGLPLGEARAALAMCRDRLAEETIDGQSYWRPTASGRTDRTSLDAYLLPPFDEYTVAYKDRGAVVESRFAPRVASGGMLNPTIVVDGRVVGSWSRTLKRDAVVITLAPFAPLKPTSRKAIAAAAARYGAFLGKEAVVA